MVCVGEPREGTSLLHRRATRWQHGKLYGVLAATALLAIASILLTFSTPRGIVLNSVDQDIARIEAENRRLEQEEISLVKLSMAQKKRKVAKAHALPKPAVHKNHKNVEDEVLKAENLKLMLKNAELKHQLLMARFDKSGITNRIEGDLFQSDQLNRGRVLSKRGAKISSLSRSDAFIKAGSRRSGVQQLVGEYVKTCTPWGCKVTYKPEDGDMNMTWYPGQSSTNKSNVWYGMGHKQLVMGNNLGLPFGPIRRQNITRYQPPQNDIIPKHSKIGDNWVGFGHDDAFVKVEDSGLGPFSLLPPWKQGPLYNFNNYNFTYKPLPGFQRFIPNGSDPSAYKEVNVTYSRCPGDPLGHTGLLCISGGDGVDGVYESSPFAPTYFDPNKILMEKHGVVVDSWPGLTSDVPERHLWGGDAKDYYKGANAKEFDYDTAEHPYWAYDNHALRSLPAYHDPDGPANKQLMLGADWNSTHPALPDLGDNWVDNITYKLQFEPLHGDTEDDDHFSNWTHDSPENVKLLYGESSLFSGLRSKKNSTEQETDPWSLWDVPLNVSQVADLAGLASSTVARSGEPLHDFQNGWQGQNLVAAGNLNLQTEAPLAEPYEGFEPSAGRITLEGKGVNVGSSWWN